MSVSKKALDVLKMAQKQVIDRREADHRILFALTKKKMLIRDGNKYAITNLGMDIADRKLSPWNYGKKKKEVQLSKIQKTFLRSGLKPIGMQRVVRMDSAIINRLIRRELAVTVKLKGNYIVRTSEYAAKFIKPLKAEMNVTENISFEEVLNTKLSGLVLLHGNYNRIGLILEKYALSLASWDDNYPKKLKKQLTDFLKLDSKKRDTEYVFDFSNEPITIPTLRDLEFIAHWENVTVFVILPAKPTNEQQAYCTYDVEVQGEQQNSVGIKII